MRGGRTHNVTQRTDTHIFKGGGGRTHTVTQQTDTQIFFYKRYWLTDKAIYWGSMLPKKIQVYDQILYRKNNLFERKYTENKPKDYLLGIDGRLQEVQSWG